MTASRRWFVFKKKYGPTLDEVLATRERLTEELETLDQSEDRLVTLRSEVDALAKEALDKAKGLTKARKKAAKDLSRAVVNELKDMELAAARFEVEIEPVHRLVIRKVTRRIWAAVVRTA